MLVLLLSGAHLVAVTLANENHANEKLTSHAGHAAAMDVMQDSQKHPALLKAHDRDQHSSAVH